MSYFPISFSNFQNINSKDQHKNEDYQISEQADKSMTIWHRNIPKQLEHHCTCHQKQLSSKSYSKPADVYSFGITAWEIMAAQVPFSQAKSSFDLIKLVSEGNRPEKLPSNKCPPALWKNIIVPSWDQEPSQRPTFTELVERLSSPLAILGN